MRTGLLLGRMAEDWYPISRASSPNTWVLNLGLSTVYLQLELSAFVSLLI